jgi:hypothetical protein
MRIQSGRIRTLCGLQDPDADPEEIFTYSNHCPHLSVLTVDQMLLHSVDTTPLHLGPAYCAPGKPFPRHTNVFMGQQKRKGVQMHRVL